MKNIAVILAGGSGNRFASILPKQFLKVNNKTILEYSINAFQQNKLIHQIIVVSNSNYIKETKEIIAENNYTKLLAVLKGGKERYDSSLSAINFIKEESNLIFHDAVRPLVSGEIITNVVTALSKYSAVNVAIPASDTILEVSENKSLIRNIPDRRFLYQAQTPQAFKWSVIKNAYKIGLNNKDFRVTDDCGVVNKYLPKEEIYIVQGEQKNIKITYPTDIQIMEQLMRNKM